MAVTLKSIDVKAYTELMMVEARLVDVGDVILSVNYGQVEGFTVDEANFGEDGLGRRTVEIYGVLGEHVTRDPREIIQVVRTKLEVD